MIKTAEHCVSCDLNGERVILNTSSGVYFGLDEVGSRIWELLAEPSTEDAIVKRLTEEYDVDEETVRRDVQTFLGNLNERGLILTDG